MTPKELAESFDNRILAFLHNVGSELTVQKIFIETPRHIWDEETGFFEWWLLVYTHARVDRPPENALVIMVRLLLLENDRAKILLELETVGGRPVDDIDPDEWFPFDDIRLSEQVSFLEEPGTIREVAARVRAYIVQARRKSPEGPREWSPRIKGPEMGAKKKSEKPIRVNLVEEKGWGPWRSDDDDLNERIQTYSNDFYRFSIDKEECERLVEAILGPLYRFNAPEGPREWSPKIRPIGIRGVKKACKGMEDGKLEGVDFMIRDAIQFMYEDAMTPDDGDIRYAIDETKEKFWEEDLDEDLWGPLLEKGYKDRGIMMDLMNQVTYSRTQGHYDRYVIFDFLHAQSVTDLIHSYPVEDRSWVRDTLEFQDFKNLRANFLEEFFEKLEKDLKGSDPDNRSDWNKHWKAVLADEDRVKNVRQEIWNYLRTAPELPEEEDE